MDSEKKVSIPVDTQGSEADVNMLLYKMGKSIKHMLLAIGRGVYKIGVGLLLTLLFLLRNVLWIIIGTGIGLGIGIYKLTKKGPEYVSEATIRTNFNSSRSLYNTVDYFNSLLAIGDKESLSRLFEISPEKAEQLVSFSVQPVKSEIIATELYKEQFMQYNRSSKIRQDTFWTRTIEFKDFKESLTQFDYPYHTITVKATNASIFPQLQKGIINQISNNDLLQQIKKRQGLSNQDEEKLIVSSIQNIDTLRRAYNQRLVRGQTAATPNSNQLTVLETSPDTKTPELDLYDKILELQDELKKTRKKSVTENDIIEIFASFSPVGKKISLLENLSSFALWGLSISVIILCGIALYRLLLTFDATRKGEKKSIQNEVA